MGPTSIAVANVPIETYVATAVAKDVLQWKDSAILGSSVPNEM